MSSRPRQPQVERRHRLGRVLVDERRERLHVVALERLDVAREELALLRVGGRRPARRPRARSPRAWPVRAGARCSPTRRSSRGAPPPRSPATAAPRRGCSTARCRGGRCWSAATNARRIVSRATATSAGSPSSWTTSASGAGSIHVTSGSVLQVPTRSARARAEVHRPRAPLAPREHVEADVRRDPVEPRAERRAALEPVEALPGAEERLLHRVLGLEDRAEHPVAVARQLAAMLARARSRARSGRGSWHPRPPSAPIVGERRARPGCGKPLPPHGAR